MLERLAIRRREHGDWRHSVLLQLRRAARVDEEERVASLAGQALFSILPFERLEPRRARMRRRAPEAARRRGGIVHGLRGHAGLVAEHQHEHVGPAGRRRSARPRSRTSTPRRSAGSRRRWRREVDPCAELSAAPPITQTSWSNAQARAVSSTWSSSVRPLYGSSCLGAPRRCDPPAARTRPVTNGTCRLWLADNRRSPGDVRNAESGRSSRRRVGSSSHGTWAECWSSAQRPRGARFAPASARRQASARGPSAGGAPRGRRRTRRGQRAGGSRATRAALVIAMNEREIIEHLGHRLEVVGQAGAAVAQDERHDRHPATPSRGVAPGTSTFDDHNATLRWAVV